MKPQNRYKILVVDDSPQDVRVILDSLSTTYEAFFAMDGSEALRISERELPDLTLLDIYMDEMDGFEVCRRLKRIPEIAENPVIFITGSSEEMDHVKGLEMGAVDFIGKPINTTVLKQRVALHLRLITAIKDGLTEIEARKQAEENLQKRERLYRMLAENITDVIWTVDENQKFTYLSPSIFTLLGYTSDELLGCSLKTTLTPGSLSYVREATAKAMGQLIQTGGQPFDLPLMEYEMVHKSGKHIWVEVRPSFMTDQNGIVNGMIGVARDISERKRAETALKISESNYRQLFNSEPDAIIIADAETNQIVDVNPAALNLYGYGYDEICRLQAVDLSAEPQKSAKHIHQVLSDESSDGDGYREIIQRLHKSKDGKKFPVEIAHGFYNRDGRKMICAIMRDISERKRMENELAAEKERLTVTLRSIGDGVISTDLEGKITLVNKVAEELTGWKEEEAIGKPITEVFHIVNEFSRNRGEDPVGKVLQTGGIIGLANHTLLISKDGKEHVIADSGAPIMDSQNKTIGAVLVFRDITEKRKMEKELAKVQKLESLGVLAGGIAHDFNNFLTAIIGNLSLAKLDAPFGDQVIAQLNGIEKASLQAKALTQQLLTFSKGGEPVKKWVNLAELIRNSAVFSLRGSNVRCDFSISENLLPVEADEGQIGQVINNLVLNADHAMPEGGVVKINVDNFYLAPDNEFSLPEGPYLRVSFRDHGVGIRPDHLVKVFDPYFTTKQKGSGLGLTVAYSIIDKHNGRLTVESELGQGTIFTIYLPASEKPTNQKIDEEMGLFIGKGKLLLMDDEEFIRDVAVKMLNKMGYEVLVAKDGNEAISIYRQAQQAQEPFDVVIMDLTVPGGMGGKEAIQELKKLDPDIKALVSSGYSNDPIMSNFSDFGFEGVVTKPYRIQDMSNALRSVFSRNTE